MALVAYSDDSDLGTDSEDGEEAREDLTKKTSDGKASVKPARVSPSKPVNLRKGVESIENEEEDILSSDKPSSTLFSSVPAAIPVSSLLGVGVEEDDEVVDVPTVETWKVTRDLKKQSNDGVAASQQGTQEGSTHRKNRKKVKIFVPSLSEFADDDEDEEERKEPPRKKLIPSSSGCGLFAVLPEPKHLATKEAGRSLVPHILTKQPSKPLKPKRKVLKAAAAPDVADHVSDEDEDEPPTGTSDFFSLSEPLTTGPAMVAGELSTSQVLAAVAPNVELREKVREVSRVPCSQPEELPSVLQQQYQYSEEEGSSNFVPFSSQPEATTAALGGIDEATLLRLAGKRGRAEAISFIDVNADDALLTREEWMTKALTEEKPLHGFSKKREGMPTQKQKQKHQITYLAHQAKERELDLKNTWAQNKMTKMQSQAKYGF
ncbi:Proline-rich protein PRCC [Chionoecetes opilio]|uniref:Proline-rich protein PRCC n=1 Tax=Chionoecetes opilio TaxID=41210 RepID=A0A8J4Y0G6_CHIOP|nr:Proline-rich protein PRCC [Chionoecetes opilio]